MQFIQACLLTKQNFFWCFDAGLEHMAARSRGNGTNFDWLRKSCDISTCDLSPGGKSGKVRKAFEISYTDVLTILLFNTNNKERDGRSKAAVLLLLICC